MLLDKIKADQLAARKAGDKLTATLLTTLLGEASPAGNATVTDDDVIKVIRKFIKNNTETLAAIKPTSSNAARLLGENATLNGYLPAVFNEADIAALIAELNTQNIGQIMGACKKKANEEGKIFDGALVQKVMKGTK